MKATSPWRLSRTSSLHKISPDELRLKLIEHQQALTGDGEHRLKLSNHDLTDIDLQHEDLREADFTGSVLTGADLRGADLSSALLNDAILDEANLNDTKLYNANLTNTKLSKARGFSADSLAGVDLTGAELPEGIQSFRRLGYVENVSRNARALFFTLLFVCAYAFLTIFATTDERLITNSDSSSIPLTGAEAPIVSFYGAMPFLVTALYLYFILYLNRLWRRLAILPAILPDGTALTATIYPWLLNDLIREYRPHLQRRKRILYQFDKLLSVLLAWCIPPLTILWFWWRYLPRHDLPLTLWHILLVGIALFVGVVLFRVMTATMGRGPSLDFSPSGKDTSSFTLIDLLAEPKSWLAPTLGIITVSIVSIGARYGEVDHFNKPCEDLGCHVSRAVPHLVEFLGHRTYLDLRGKDVSEWRQVGSGQTEDLALHGVKGADLRGKNLNYAFARDAFLAKANLQGAQLNSSDLRYADLRKTDFFNAQLRDANLDYAKLSGAGLSHSNLSGAFLQGAKLEKADLKNAILEDTFLEGANLGEADLTKAKLNRANLNDADLTKANLNGADLKGASLKNAKLEDADLSGAKLRESKDLTEEQLKNSCGNKETELPEDIGWNFELAPCAENGRSVDHVDLRSANLNNATLSWTSLSFADLSGSSLKGANLEKSDLIEATLSGAMLEGADLNEADLTDAKLNGAVLTGADLRRANHKGADFTGAELEETKLEGANLSGTILHGAKGLTEEQLETACGNYETKMPESIGLNVELISCSERKFKFRRARLVEANLSDAILSKKDLSGASPKNVNLNKSCLKEAILNGAILENSSLVEADLTDAKLNGAILKGADLTEAILDGADLTGANLQNADLKDTKLNGTNLYGTKGLTEKQLEAACGNEETILPKFAAVPSNSDDIESEFKLKDCGN